MAICPLRKQNNSLQKVGLRSLPLISLLLAISLLSAACSVVPGRQPAPAPGSPAAGTDTAQPWDIRELPPTATRPPELPFAPYITPTVMPAWTTPTATPTPTDIVPPTPTPLPDVYPAADLLYLDGEQLMAWSPAKKTAVQLSSDVVAYSTSADGQTIGLLRRPGGTRSADEAFQLAVLRMDEDAPQVVIAETPLLYHLSISPDGKWLAYINEPDGGLLYAVFAGPDQDPQKIGSCVNDLDSACQGYFSWSSERLEGVWSDSGGVWLSGPYFDSPQRVMPNRVEIADPKGNKVQVDVRIDQFRWSPYGRYALVRVSPRSSEVVWQSVLDTRTGRIAEVPGTYQVAGQAARQPTTSLVWMPNGTLLAAEPGDVERNHPPALKIWRVVPTHENMLLLNSQMDLTPQAFPLLETAPCSEAGCVPLWPAAWDTRRVGFGLTSSEPGASAMLYLLDLKYDQLQEANQVPAGVSQVLWAPDLNGAVVLTTAGEALFSPVDGRPLLEIPAAGLNLEMLRWHPIQGTNQ